MLHVYGSVLEKGFAWNGNPTAAYRVSLRR